MNLQYWLGEYTENGKAHSCKEIQIEEEEKIMANKQWKIGGKVMREQVCEIRWTNQKI